MFRSQLCFLRDFHAAWVADRADGGGFGCHVCRRDTRGGRPALGDRMSNPARVAS